MVVANSRHNEAFLALDKVPKRGSEGKERRQFLRKQDKKNFSYTNVKIFIKYKKKKSSGIEESYNKK